MENDQLLKKSPIQAKKYYYLVEGLEFIVNLIVTIVLIFLWSHFHWWHFLIYIFIGLLILDLLYALIGPWIKYNYTYYRVNKDYIEIKRDFFFKKQEIVKFERTQFIEQKYNPMLKKLSLVKLSLVTAGHHVTFPLMHTEDAETFESTTFDYLRGADFDV
ncbi:PH domain-containing protein [Staphylococcus caeli]|uniref:Membrane protein n=1 Tax=Staphylococcus caeli TaxID=2201815 RepID=A0A1D4RSD8_9STAP|nr:PH domain-containing protein [Staphylococcus caeli]SCT50376.1 membrane protein [Staphylococcus caeli]SCT51418.1 membrane protein [Staphylococcus caeli]